MVNAVTMAHMSKQQGKIIAAPGLNVWEHELRTAQALADAGYVVEFIRRSEEKRAKSADVLIDGVAWEMKSPTADNLHALDRNLRRGLHQSGNIVLDSFRIKQVPDYAVERELRKLAAELRSLKHLKFVNRKRAVIDIK